MSRHSRHRFTFQGKCRPRWASPSSLETQGLNRRHRIRHPGSRPMTPSGHYRSSPSLPFRSPASRLSGRPLANGRTGLCRKCARMRQQQGLDAGACRDAGPKTSPAGRPHRSPGNLPPATYAKRSVPVMQRGEFAAQRPVASRASTARMQSELPHRRMKEGSLLTTKTRRRTAGMVCRR
jgi:hypothetical protein